MLAEIFLFLSITTNTLIFILALVSLPISSTFVGFILLLLLGPIEKSIQWGKKSAKEWKQLGVENPGERLAFVSVLFSVIDNTISRTSALLVAQSIFHYFADRITVPFIILYALIFVIHDIARIKRFTRNSGIWTEIGYLLGDVISVIIAMIIFV